MIKRSALLLLSLLALPALAIDIGTMPNGSNYVPGLGAAKTTFAGTLTRYTTTGDKQVVTGVGAVQWLLAATGTTITAVFWDATGGTCNTGTQKTGTITLVNGTPIQIPGTFALGVCMTVGGTSPDVTISTLP